MATPVVRRIGRLAERPSTRTLLTVGLALCIAVAIPYVQSPLVGECHDEPARHVCSPAATATIVLWGLCVVALTITVIVLGFRGARKLRRRP
jgi:hypothetical protein